jgi:hypothetical protein
MTDQPEDAWYFSRDGELWIEAGSSRDDAIEAGRDDLDGEGFHIGVGIQFPLNPQLLHTDYLGDIIDNANEEAGWEDGLTNEIGQGDLQALTDTINAAWWKWAQGIGLQSRVRGLSVTQQEWIEPTAEYLVAKESTPVPEQRPTT